ncbi:peptidase inhibitor family I36 protein [Nonomuraea endophytica]|uniref:peptidase inhibitor family I36 protein n=1 Tax=Nonomuraea endophytica TaxID=714136 RepID=UPI0037C9CA62
MSQRTQMEFRLQPSPTKRGHVGAVKPRLLGAIGAAVIMLAPVLATSSAQASASASSTGTAGQALVRGVHVFERFSFSGLHAWLDGNVGQCRYVGAGWNDRIRSARTESARVVELWEHANCTGTGIVVDRSGYGRIGAWVSAYRIR